MSLKKLIVVDDKAFAGVMEALNSAFSEMGESFVVTLQKVEALMDTIRPIEPTDSWRRPFRELRAAGHCLSSLILIIVIRRESLHPP